MNYQFLRGENWRHIWVVGDLHGCRAQLDAALQARHFDTDEDLLISVGDLIDRGPDSPGCLELLQQPWFRAVRGNHEEMALAAINHNEILHWMMNGGEWFWQLQGSALISTRHALKRCAELPLVLHLQRENDIVVIAHADYPASHYAWEHELDWQQVMWGRNRINHLMQGEGEGIAGAQAFYFGHTPLQRPLHRANLHYIDTGAVFGNGLTLEQLQ
ncbi:metallophosphoesterase [Pantoea sp. A4]|uniref:metallophosphoesterase n=1 Tax=Pantoea sp. A4 TaxID=1225184 RepID=UPI000369B347|nr:metallophosphoesterase [Pantoea sp. A4]